MKKFFSLMLVMMLALSLAACGSTGENAGGNDGGGDEGGGEKPEKLVMGFVPSQDSGEIAATVEPLEKQLSEELGITVEGKVMTNYSALVEAMGSNTVQIGFLPPFGYVLAKKKHDVEVILKSERNGGDSYRAQYVVRADSGIKSFEDLKGKVWAVADLTSASGYLFPAAQLMNKFDIEKPQQVQSGFFKSTVQSGGHDNSLITVLQGDADVATTFEDARTTITEDYPKAMDKLKVIGYTEPIPNDTISVTKEMDDALKQKIKDAFLSFNENEEMIKVMNEVYNWDAIIEAQDSDYDIVRDTYEKFGGNVEL